MMTSRRWVGEPSLVRVYALVVTVVTLVTVAVGALVSLHQPFVYTSHADVQVLPVATRGAPIAPDMGTERELALSGSVAQRAAATLGTTVRAAQSGLSVDVVTDTAVLVVRYDADNPHDALAGAGAFTRSYVETRNSRQNARAATIITRPTAPERSAAESVGLVLGVCLLAGLLLGFGCAWLWDRVSDRVRSSGELARIGPAVFASRLPVPRGRIGLAVRRRDDFAYLAGRVSLASQGRRCGVRVLVTAPRGSSGASAISLNLAMALSRPGQGVALVDLDRRSRGLSRIVRGVLWPGLDELLSGTSSVSEVMRPVGADDVRLIPAAVTQPTPQLDVAVASLMLSRLSRHDIVVVDGPPLLEAPEAMLLAGQVDMVLLVADLSKLTRADAARTVELLGTDDPSGPVVGWVTHDRGSALPEPDLDVEAGDPVHTTVPAQRSSPTVRMADVDGVQRNLT
jgi:polysaccharide biosynthesis transport protein